MQEIPMQVSVHWRSCMFDIIDDQSSRNVTPFALIPDISETDRLYWNSEGGLALRELTKNIFNLGRQNNQCNGTRKSRAHWPGHEIDEKAQAQRSHQHLDGAS